MDPRISVAQLQQPLSGPEAQLQAALQGFEVISTRSHHLKLWTFILLLAQLFHELFDQQDPALGLVSLELDQSSIHKKQPLSTDYVHSISTITSDFRSQLFHKNDHSKEPYYYPETLYYLCHQLRSQSLLVLLQTKIVPTSFTGCFQLSVSQQSTV